MMRPGHFTLAHPFRRPHASVSANPEGLLANQTSHRTAMRCKIDSAPTSAYRSDSEHPDAPNVIYLDNAATTPLNPKALEAMMPYLVGNYGNASASYGLARQAWKAIDD